MLVAMHKNIVYISGPSKFCQKSFSKNTFYNPFLEEKKEKNAYIYIYIYIQASRTHSRFN